MPEPSDAASASLQSERLGVAPATRVLDVARAARRYSLFAVFFTGQQPGERRQKMQRAYRLIDDVTDPVEHARLRALLGNLQSVADACPPPEAES